MSNNMTQTAEEAAIEAENDRLAEEYAPLVEAGVIGEDEVPYLQEATEEDLAWLPKEKQD